MKINISRAHFPVTTLGPGARLGIWLQGCSIRCAGCISADTWAFGAGEIDVDMLLQDLEPWLTSCDGVTVSGGEPFDQHEALVVLLKAIKRDYQHDILVYSGYSLEHLKPYLSVLAGQIDALVSDPFVTGAPRSLSLRGSDNQRLSLLTERGRERFLAYEGAVAPMKRSLDVMFGADGVTWMAGIPKNDDFIRMESMMSAAGHRTVTSRAKWGHQ